MTRMNVQIGSMLVIELLDAGRTARLHLTPDGSEYLRSISRIGESDVEFDLPHGEIYPELFEDIQANSSVRLIDGLDKQQIGALTDAPIFAFDVDHNDDGSLERIGDTYWFPNYMVHDELAELTVNGCVDFVRSD